MLLKQPNPSAMLSLAADASNYAVGVIQKQLVSDTWFWSRCFRQKKPRYSAFGRELPAPYGATKHFRHVVEGLYFVLFIDHKPPTYPLYTKSDPYCPREVRHSDNISQFTTDLRHVKGASSCSADAISLQQLNDVAFLVLDLPAMAVA